MKEIFSAFDRGDHTAQSKVIYPAKHHIIAELEKKTKSSPQTKEEALENQKINKQIKETKEWT